MNQTSDQYIADSIIDRVAMAMYARCAQSYSWDEALPAHKDLWRRYATAAIQEVIALQNLQAAFPEAQVIGQ